MDSHVSDWMFHVSCWGSLLFWRQRVGSSETPCKNQGNPWVSHIEFRAPLSHMKFALSHMKMSPFGESAQNHCKTLVFRAVAGQMSTEFTRDVDRVTRKVQNLQTPEETHTFPPNGLRINCRNIYTFLGQAHLYPIICFDMFATAPPRNRKPM